MEKSFTAPLAGATKLLEETLALLKAAAQHLPEWVSTKEVRCEHYVGTDTGCRVCGMLGVPATMFVFEKSAKRPLCLGHALLWATRGMELRNLAAFMQEVEEGAQALQARFKLAAEPPATEPSTDEPAKQAEWEASRVLATGAVGEEREKALAVLGATPRLNPPPAPEDEGLVPAPVAKPDGRGRRADEERQRREARRKAKHAASQGHRHERGSRNRHARA